MPKDIPLNSNDSSIIGRGTAELMIKIVKYNQKEISIMVNNLSDFLICQKCGEGNQFLTEDTVKCLN
jgi:hypothetical protein